MGWYLDGCSCEVPVEAKYAVTTGRQRVRFYDPLWNLLTAWVGGGTWQHQYAVQLIEGEHEEVPVGPLQIHSLCKRGGELWKIEAGESPVRVQMLDVVSPPLRNRLQKEDERIAAAWAATKEKWNKEEEARRLSPSGQAIAAMFAAEDEREGYD